MPTFATIRADLDTDRSQINDHLRHLLAGEHGDANGIVQEAMRYAVLGTAQRIRPILALRVARLLDAPADLACRAASAVELLHCASLIVDDLPCMDDSATRRGQPSVHVKFGEATAVLAAFGLVALASRILVEVDCSGDERRRLLNFQIKLLRSMDCAGLIAGQALDLQLTGNRYRRTDRQVTELKTVPLFQLAVEAGCLFSDLDANEEALLRCFGREFGLAFQMTDDVLDGEAIPPARIAGKLTTLRAAISPFDARACELEEM